MMLSRIPGSCVPSFRMCHHFLRKIRVELTVEPCGGNCTEQSNPISRGSPDSVTLCEQVPMLPAWAVRMVWDDPRRIPYLLVWKSRHDGSVKDAVRVARSAPRTSLPEAESVQIK